VAFLKNYDEALALVERRGRVRRRAFSSTAGSPDDSISCASAQVSPSARHHHSPSPLTQMPSPPCGMWEKSSPSHPAPGQKLN
jgi:hypothetical protein